IEGFGRQARPSEPHALIWDIASRKKLRDLPGVTDVRFRADGRRFVTAGPGEPVTVWDAGDCSAIHVLRKRPEPQSNAERHVEKLTYHPSGRYIVLQDRAAVPAKDLPPDTQRSTQPVLRSRVVVWDDERGSELHTIFGVSSPDERHILAD